MRQLVREHARWVWGTFLGVSAICTVLVIFVPQLPRTLASFWFVAWISVPLAVGFLIRLMQVNDRQHILLLEKSTEIETLKDDSRNSQTALNEERERSIALSTDRENLLSELEVARARISSLETPAPTDRDRRLFKRLIEEWPWNGGTLWWLENAFNAKTWSSSTASQVVVFADVERETFFDNPVVDASFQDFKKACDALSRWLTFESYPHPANWDLQQVPDGSDRAGGWPEFQALRDQGMQLSNSVIEARRELEHMGRSHGL